MKICLRAAPLVLLVILIIAVSALIAVTICNNNKSNNSPDGKNSNQQQQEPQQQVIQKSPPEVIVKEVVNIAPSPLAPAPPPPPPPPAVPPPLPPRSVPYFPFNQDTRLRGYEWVRVGFVFRDGSHDFIRKNDSHCPHCPHHGDGGKDHHHNKEARFPLFARAKDYQRGLFEYRIVDGSRNHIPIDVFPLGQRGRRGVAGLRNNRGFWELQTRDQVKIPGMEGLFTVDIQEDDSTRWLIPFGYRQPGQLYPRWS